MPRPVLLVLVGALTVAGCSADDCSFPAFPDVDVVPLAAAARPGADSVVVALVPVGGAAATVAQGVEAALAADAVRVGESADDSVRVRLELVAEAGVPQRAAAAVVGDTVWVRLGPAALVRPACSPPPVPGEVSVLRVEAPSGVVVRSVVVVPEAPAAPPRPWAMPVRA